MKAPKFTRFDPADYLDNPEVIAEYLKAAEEQPDSRLRRQAKRDVQRAQKKNAIS
jgi:DNA-binding phage protein